MAVPPPSTVVPSVSPELDAIVLQALERDRKLRYARAAHMARDLDVFLQAHRFAVEDMAEYMKRSFPADSREDVPTGTMTSSYSIQKQVQEPTAPSSPRAIAGTPSAVRAEARREAGASGGGAQARAHLRRRGAAGARRGRDRRRADRATRSRRRRSDEPRMVVEPTVRPAEADKPLGDDKPPDRSPADGAAPKATCACVRSPPARRSTPGRKLVGTAPVTLHLSQRPAGRR